VESKALFAYCPQFANFAYLSITITQIPWITRVVSVGSLQSIRISQSCRSTFLKHRSISSYTSK